MGDFYRFRSCRALLGEWKELETQTIFFADPKSLNDPMEGYRDIEWKGDFVVWMNLFKNYLLCLEEVLMLYKVGGDDLIIKDEDIPVFSSVDDIPLQLRKDVFLKISDAFTSHKVVITMASELSKRKYPVRRDELVLYLSQLQLIALNIIECFHSECIFGRLFSATAFNNLSALEESIVKHLDEGLIAKVDYIYENNENSAEIINELMSSRFTAQMDTGLLRKVDGTLKNVTSNKDFILIDFNRRYLSQLEYLSFPEWYTACFMSEFNNSSVWGHYGDNHTGVCLIFESDEKDGVDSISLNGVVGRGEDGEIYEYCSFELHAIDYITGVGTVDFFSMLGRLPIPKLNAEWYTFKNQRSICSRDMNSNADEWRKRYWDSFISSITKKTEHWCYENEYRLIAYNYFNDYRNPDRRTFRYNFSSLKGLIFGINTKTEDKIDIIKIIKMKCQENNINNFKFYQAYYSPKAKCIERRPMELFNAFVQSDRV